MAVAAMLAAGMAWGEGTTEQTEPEAAGLIPDTEAAGPRHAPWVWFGNLQLGGNEYDVQDGLGLGLMAEARKVRGIQVFLFGLQSEEMDGLQIAGFGNLAAHANGVQLAGFFNFAHLGGNGLQIALFGNGIRGDFAAVQRRKRLIRYLGNVFDIVIFGRDLRQIGDSVF